MADEETNEISQLQFKKLEKAAADEFDGKKSWVEVVNSYMMQVMLNNPDMSWEEFTEFFKAILSQQSRFLNKNIEKAWQFLVL